MFWKMPSAIAENQSINIRVVCPNLLEIGHNCSMQLTVNILKIALKVCKSDSIHMAAYSLVVIVCKNEIHAIVLKIDRAYSMLFLGKVLWLNSNQLFMSNSI